MTDHSNQTLLLLFAHPDDESFGCGGTMARYAANGTSVWLVCATRGEVGEISDPSLATPDTLAQVREGELRCACDTLGVFAPIFLDYRDSGMAGTPENEDPRAFVNAEADEVVPRLVEIIRRLKPQVVVTFEPNGGYGHPDHIAIHRHTVAAFHAAADPTRYPEQGAAWQAARLLYGVIPRSMFVEMRAQMAEAGLDTSEWDERLEHGEFGWSGDVHFTLDVSHTVDAKWNALHCHATQFGQESPFHQFPEAEVKKFMAREYFAQAWPQPDSALLGNDIFAGL